MYHEKVYKNAEYSVGIVEEGLGMWLEPEQQLQWKLMLSNECISPAQFHANYPKATGFIGVNWVSAVSGH